MNVTITTKSLLEILEHNKEQHIVIYKEALKGFKKEAIKQLKRKIQDIKAGSFETYVHLDAPVSQAKDYDAVIGMLKLGTDDAITLTEKEYRNYVLDDWAWKDDFLATNAYYSLTAANLKEGQIDE